MYITPCRIPSINMGEIVANKKQKTAVSTDATGKVADELGRNLVDLPVAAPHAGGNPDGLVSDGHVHVAQALVVFGLRAAEQVAAAAPAGE